MPVPDFENLHIRFQTVNIKNRRFLISRN